MITSRALGVVVHPCSRIEVDTAKSSVADCWQVPTKISALDTVQLDVTYRSRLLILDPTAPETRIASLLEELFEALPDA